MKKLLIFSIVFLFACEGKASKQKSVTTAVDSVEIKATELKLPDYSNNKWNQAARIIAGITKTSDTLFSDALNSPAWKAYASESDSVWNNYPVKNASLFEWVTQDVNPITKDYKTIFYPFSGPDFLYINMIYPNAETIYMVGLERVGSVPDFNKIKTSQLGAVFNQYKKAINEVVKDSYYRTMSMSADLHNNSIDGVTPIIMLFMARSGKQISEVNLVTLDANGGIRKADEANFRSLKNQGIEFKYYNGKDTIERKVIYMRGNAEDSYLAANPAYSNFFKNLRPEAAFNKSASYLMHWSVFSTVRNVILNNCKVTVQDDTGVAFNFFKPTEWDIILFGSYNGCISEFKNQFEPALKKAYDESPKPIKKLNFRIGYSQPANARIAIRKTK